MSVQELTTLHTRYVDLSSRFKSAWTYHQFLQGLQKILLEGRLPAVNPDFQAIYGGLKDVSQNLTASGVVQVRSHLDRVEHLLTAATRQLVAADDAVEPALVRQFFQRIKSYDEGVVTQLLRFYLLEASDEWPADRLDKVDFLLTKLGEEPQGPDGPYALRSRSQLRKVIGGLVPEGAGPELDELARQEYLAAIEEVRGHASRVEGFDELIEQETIERYRSVKHALGPNLLDPEIAIAVIETNLALKNAINRLYRKEERRIQGEYQQVFALESESVVDGALQRELSEFHRQVEGFETRLKRETISLAELGQIRSRARSLLPRLEVSGREEDPEIAAEIDEGYEIDGVDEIEPISTYDGESLGVSEDLDAVERALAAEMGEAEEPRELVRDHYRELMEALEGTDSDVAPRVAALAPVTFPFRLEPREVVAYRRIVAGEGEAAREQLILEAAALRARIQEEVEELRGILDDTLLTGDAPVFARAAATTRLADEYQRRLAHHLDCAILDADLDEARQLQRVRMRIVRESAGLWLLVHKG